MLINEQLEQWELASAYIAPDEDTDPQGVFTAKTVRILCAEVRRLKAELDETGTALLDSCEKIKQYADEVNTIRVQMEKHTISGLKDN